jgi:hypothetical protein
MKTLCARTEDILIIFPLFLLIIDFATALQANVVPKRLVFRILITSCTGVDIRRDFWEIPAEFIRVSISAY